MATVRQVKPGRNGGAAAGGGRTSGSALILAIWMVVLLSLIVSSFAFDMHIEARLTSYYRKRLRAGYLARGGIERARMLLVRSGDAEIGGKDYGNQGALWFPAARNLSRGAAASFAESLDTGSIRVDIVPEESRRNINRIGQADLEAVFESAGVPEEKWKELADALADWIDADSKPRFHGAETPDYYRKLDPPRRARNAPLATVDELLHIKGFSFAMLYGGLGENAVEGDLPMIGMDDLLTTYGDGKVNVNSASRRVLMTLAGVDEYVADMILTERENSEENAGTEAAAEDRSFKDVNDFFSRFPNLRGKLDSSITTGAGTYRITSVGDSRGVERTVCCIARVDRKTGEMSVIRWTESEGR